MSIFYTSFCIFQGLRACSKREPKDELVPLLPLLHLKFLLLPKGFVEVSSIGLLRKTLGWIKWKMAIRKNCHALKVYGISPVWKFVKGNCQIISFN